MVLSNAHSEANAVLMSARDESRQMLSSAKERAEKVRRESERELAAAAARRDAITAQLANVRQMLGTLGSTSVFNPLSELEAAAGDEAAESHDEAAAAKA